MKEFNLEKAKRGDKVISRNGHKAKILHILSKKDAMKVGTKFIIRALVNDPSDNDDNYIIGTFTKSGRYYGGHTDHSLDLFMKE